LLIYLIDGEAEFWNDRISKNPLNIKFPSIHYSSIPFYLFFNGLARLRGIMKIYLKRLIIFALPFIIWACAGKNTGDPKDGNNGNEQVFITDRTGKKWDVTHAVQKYGLNPGNFQYGLGPYAITPINNPEMLSPRDEGYPADNSGEAVIGLEIDGDARAYSIRTLSRHEVVNDRVGSKDIAVVY